MRYCIWKSYKTKGNFFRIFQALANEPYCFFLDSGLAFSSLGRYSFLGIRPFYILKKKGDTSVFSELRQVLKEYTVKPLKNAPPLLGGAVGYFSYDFGFLLEEKLKKDYWAKPEIPDVFFSFYQTVICFDHYKKELYIFSLDKEDFKNMLKTLEKVLSLKNKPLALAQEDLKLVSDFTPGRYIQAVKKAKEYIKKGDIYQVNLSQRFSGKSALSSPEIYARLRQKSPACFSGYLDAGDFQIVSSSPERFLSLRSGTVQTRPMKGTRPRFASKRKDKASYQDLLNSPKDKAELVMIVDLERNDLGKVCAYNSIKVKSLRTIEKYKTVFQATATIEGRLLPGLDALDLLRACFPGGSITGCPKIRAMEIIRELEQRPRDIYTGSLGYLSFSQDADFNILIRTLLKQDKIFSFCVGGGIVADSQPQAEYQETLDKARGMFAALGLG